MIEIQSFALIVVFLATVFYLPLLLLHTQRQLAFYLIKSCALKENYELAWELYGRRAHILTEQQRQQALSLMDREYQ